MAGKRSTFREYAEAILVAGIFLGFTQVFVLKTFYIPSASMEDTLLVGDHLVVNRFIYGPALGAIGKALLPFREVERGDVVIFRSPQRPRVDMVKRCVALPGDVVEVVDKRLYINGDPVEDDAYTIHGDDRVFPRHPDLPELLRKRDNFGPFQVPEDSYFCMGDNRDQSYDSRYWGTVPRQFLKGRAVIIYWSYGGETSDGTWRGWGVKLRQILETLLGFFTETRWGRTFRLIR